MEQTNLTKIKEVSKLLFDAVEIKANNDFKFLVQHPFASNSLVSIPLKSKNITKLITEYKRAIWKLIHDNEKKRFNMSKGLDTHYRGLLNLIETNMVDITIPEGKEIFRAEIFNFIDSSKLLIDILMLINKPWYMTFLKYTEVYMSDKDLGSILGQCWVEEEYPNRDINASLKEIINLFRRANKKALMDESEYKEYEYLRTGIPWKPRICLTVYRGVAGSGKPRGLSWTTNLEKAKWFATRFKLDNPKLYRMTIRDPEAILAYFNSRGESEVVVDITKCKDWEEINLWKI